MIAGLAYGLVQEVNREEQRLREGISGTIHLNPNVGWDVIKTDNAYIVLLDPKTHRVAAIQVVQPFVPPVTFAIGKAQSVDGKPLHGSYQIFMFTDKDGHLAHPVTGEISGELTNPIPLGTESTVYVMDRPFQQTPFLGSM